MKKDTAADTKTGIPKTSVRIISKRKSIVYAEPPPITYLINSLLSAGVMWEHIRKLRIFKNQSFSCLTVFIWFRGIPGFAGSIGYACGLLSDADRAANLPCMG